MTEAGSAGAQPAPTLFTQLVMMLSTSAFQQMGKIVNPMTGKSETNLKDAEAIISLIEMLETKTKGNLEDTEQKFLADTLASLRLTYVETAKDADAADEVSKDDTTETPQAEGEEDKKVESTSDGEKNVKFHKKYE